MMHPISAENRIKFIWKIINKKYADPNFNVKSLANELNLSTSHLREIIYSFFSISPQDLIERFRLDKSIELLCKMENVCYTASEVGYAYTRSYRRVFTRHFEFTPYVLKKAAQSNERYMEKLIQICRKELWGENLYNKVLIMTYDYVP